MNPLKRIQYNSPVILTFALVSLLVLGLAALTNNRSNVLLFSVYRTSWSDPLAYLRIFTHALGHANAQHFFGNFILILLIGPMLEEKYGGKDILTMMIVTAFVTGVLHIFISQNPKLGASGIVFMLILLGSFTNLQRGRIPLTLILALTIFVGQEIISAGSGTNTNIAYLTHIVGGLCGAMFGFIANKHTFGGSE